MTDVYLRNIGNFFFFSILHLNVSQLGICCSCFTSLFVREVFIYWFIYFLTRSKWMAFCSYLMFCCVWNRCILYQVELGYCLLSHLLSSSIYCFLFLLNLVSLFSSALGLLFENFAVAVFFVCVVFFFHWRNCERGLSIFTISNIWSTNKWWFFLLAKIVWGVKFQKEHKK